MKIQFSKSSWEDYNSWLTNDEIVLQKINRLIKEIQFASNQGSGKAIPLKFDLNGLFSRYIYKEHRLIYQVSGDELRIYSCRYHYDK
jgi:toxin YoeB